MPLWSEERDVDPKNTPFIQRTFGIDSSVMGFNDAFNDGETQTGAGDVPGFIILDTIETGKDSLQVLRGNAQSGI